MAAVTYNGVESAEGGNIFKDVKLWVAMRVPMRKAILDMITNNGGTVVPLEKHADILIADHVRKDAPSGSYSWKFVTESVENGIIQIKDRYLIGRDPTLPRPAGRASHGKKSTRTPFTSAEDAALAKWVLAHNVNQLGNKIFQEFEAANPRHTWQSWRSRFVKNLQVLPVDQLQALAASAPEQEPNGNEEETGEVAEVQPQSQLQPQPQKTAAVIPHRLVQRSSPPPAKTAEPVEPIPDSLQVEIDARQDDVSDAELSDLEDDIKMKEFYEDLNEYITTFGRDIKLRPKISGKTIELWDLVVAAQEARRGDIEGLGDVDWLEVAVVMGFEADDTSAASQLCQCYAENLAEFMEAMESFDEEEDETAYNYRDPISEFSPGGRVPSDGPLSESFPERSPPLDPPSTEEPGRWARSSPPIGVKRSLGQRSLSSSGPLTKRPRYNKNIEIPSTPDMDHRVRRQFPSAQLFSPSVRKSLSRQDYVDVSEASQHLPPFHEEELQVEEEPEDEIEELEVSEPREAQPQSPLLDTEATPAHGKPSQQLTNEALNPSPIPFSLSNRARQPTKTELDRPGSKAKQTSEIGSNQRQEARRGATAVPAQELSSTIQKGPKRPSRRSLPATFRSNPQPKPPTASAPTEAPRRPLPMPSESNRRDIDAWIRYYESLEFPRSVVIEGLKRTTLTPGNLASLVMQSLKDGKEIPSHHEGIWTDRDDAELTLVASVDLRVEPSGPVAERQYRKARRASDRLVKKHGPARIELRKSFLDAQNAGKPNSGS
ncbi:TRF2-interacting telomeric protein/Rap1 C terminal domain-containing protein [Dactylonectria macrodidyma]|uniref:DNA-binding protein RAP1 n=1 Tax=Dactylonectria macrodidyma TaxID=307937 RepID=A0A9P9FEN1_9HYPO|nr:TRF2-interacting telomeric protein/Rap1 C terminal domain-containing protein [Dactylonectria macrodidyma]